MMPLCEVLASSAARARPKSVIVLAAFQKHVARLYVSMNDSAAMGCIQAIGYLQHHPGRLGCGKLAFTSPEVAQRFMQERHHEIEHASSLHFRFSGMIDGY